MAYVSGNVGCNAMQRYALASKKETARVEKFEKETVSFWLRNGQEGGVEGLAKQLNQSVTYCKDRFNGTQPILPRKVS
eukprot:1648982-Pyramimonas_sp.AAC.2